MENSTAELESFRQKWREEVLAKTKSNIKPPKAPAEQHSGSSRRPPAHPRIAPEKVREFQEKNEQIESPRLLDAEKPSSAVLIHDGENSKQESREPRSALEYYEKAVERESLGSLGDSLDLYRKAFRLDSRVDQKYKNKHFPPSSLPSKPTITNQSGSLAPPPNIDPSIEVSPLTINQLLASFSNLAIVPAPPALEGTPALPCYIANLPGEILVYIFREVAEQDVACFVRLAQVCKHMAFVVATEEPIWKQICQGSEVGFLGMHYEWQREVSGEPLEPEESNLVDDSESGVIDSPASTIIPPETLTTALLHAVYKSSWHQMFRLRPRIRFNGCYISTNNYIRPGQASVDRITWNSPVLIVTYYRYLRFFRDGTLISLLTTSEPADVVHYLTKDLLVTPKNKRSAHLPSAVTESALRGRWRLSSVYENPEVDLKDAEGDLFIETEASPKYIYRMDLSLRHAGRGAKNNKLVWGGFWSYNKLTDDWAEFTRRNEKALFWSRVKSYGRGD